MSNDLFVDLKSEVENVASDCGPDITEIESLCLQCRRNGKTKVFLTKIPYFKEVAVMSFACDECGWTNNELQPVSSIQEKGVRYVVKCNGERDLNRQIVKTELAEITIPEIEFEVKKQSGLVTTIEGIIDRAVEGLKETLISLSEQHKESKEKLALFLVKLNDLKSFKQPFTFILNDPTGNSFVENPFAPNSDPSMEITHYSRTLEQNKLIGCVSGTENGTEICSDAEFNISGEVLQFPTNCSNCNAACFTNMKVTKIPHFKEVIIMATSCDACGKRTNEIKSGAGVEEKGVRITKRITEENDLKLDVVRVIGADTINLSIQWEILIPKDWSFDLSIPEIELEVEFSGNGRYTTIEGLVENVKEQLKNANPFVCGDSVSENVKEKMDNLFQKMSTLLGLTVIIDDPCGNSFIQNADSVVNYERTFEQNEELGLNDIRTDNYQQQ